MAHRRHIFLTFFMILAFAGRIEAQVSPVDSLVAAGDSLRRAYYFEKSLEAYSQALEIVTDTTSYADSALALTISDRILLSENGKNMTGFVYEPSVVAKHIFSKEDFFLYYPLKDRSWRTVPNQLDSL